VIPTVLEVGKQAAVAQSEIRAVRRLVKQLPVGILQHSSNVSSCMRTRIVMNEHYTACQHSTLFVLNGPTQFFSVSQCTYDVTVVPCCMDSTISTPFLSQKRVAISFQADVCLDCFGLSGECVCIHCYDRSLVSTFTNKIHVLSPATSTM
jgi:hypothetical protein